MDHNNWYADTAYDSRKKKEVPPPDPAGWGTLGQRSLRAHTLPLGVHCGDYRYLVRKDFIKELKKNISDGFITHEHYTIGSLCNPMLAVALFRWLGGAFSIFGFLAIITTNPSKENLLDWQYNIYFTIPFTIFVICSILVYFVPNKNNIILNRRTGMVTIPRLGRKIPIVLPFAECDGYYFCPQSKTGWTYNLYLGHRFSPHGEILIEQRSRRHTLHADWEFFQQYMDISMPLPDLPELEPYRHLDPTTAEYDKRHSRPPHYWRDFDLEQVSSEVNKGYEVIKNFPWEKLPTDHIPQELKDRVPRMAKMLS